MNSPGFLWSLALLWAAATMARRCGRRSTAAPGTFLEGGNTPSDGNSSLSNMTKECGKTVRDKIVGGDPTTPNQYPWMVFLIVDVGNGTKLCGGSLVTDRHVVTAAHCVVNTSVETVFNPSNYTVVVRAYEMKAEIIGVASVWPHEDYVGQPSSHNDIAILTLARPVTPGPATTPVCLPYALRGVDLAGREAILVGFGVQWHGGPAPDKLMSATLTIVSHEKCIKKKENITPDHICAANVNGSQAACTGDSGGPLMMAGPGDSMYLVGVASYVEEGCAVPGYPDVFTRVTEFLDWIDARVRGPPPTGPSVV